MTALLPVTGIPLPFISNGGTSLVLTCAVLGMLVSFARHEPAAARAAQQAADSGSTARWVRQLRLGAPRVAAASPARSVAKQAAAAATVGRPSSRRHAAGRHGGGCAGSPPARPAIRRPASPAERPRHRRTGVEHRAAAGRPAGRAAAGPHRTAGRPAARRKGA